jgi:hypothetical protein
MDASTSINDCSLASITLTALKTTNYGKQEMAWKNCRTIHPISNRTIKRRETMAYAMMKTASIMVDAICNESPHQQLSRQSSTMHLQFDPAIAEALKLTKLV